MFHLSHRASLSFFEHTRSVFTVRKSIAVEEPEPTVRNDRPRDYAYNKGQRCLSLLVWLLGVDYVSCTSCTAGSKGHRLLGSLLWGDATTSIFWGVGPNFHAFNESRPPCGRYYVAINS